MTILLYACLVSHALLVFREARRGGLGLIKLELWTIVNCHVGIKPTSSAKAANTLDY